MAAGGDITLRDVSHPSLNEALKAHNSVTFKLVRTGEYGEHFVLYFCTQHEETANVLEGTCIKGNLFAENCSVPELIAKKRVKLHLIKRNGLTWVGK